MKNQQMNKINHEYAVFILTNGRPNKVYTYNALRKHGYTGKIYLIIDDLDSEAEQYKKKYPEQVIIFNKKEIAKSFDNGDNFKDYRAIIYARNACFSIAKKLNIKNFIQLDDDYEGFYFRFDNKLDYNFEDLYCLDSVFSSMFKFLNSSEQIKSIALSQGGDFIGGESGTNKIFDNVTLKRKCMNSFFCSTDKEFKFIGRVNEDVNTYCRLASTGDVFFTINQVSLRQKATQTNSGGMTEMYLESGTYIKSFYSVMYHPSSVKIRVLNSNHKRIHHSIKWSNTTPMILNEKYRKIK